MWKKDAIDKLAEKELQPEFLYEFSALQEQILLLKYQAEMDLDRTDILEQLRSLIKQLDEKQEDDR